MIKIISGWTNKGGSTFALINLTNGLNEAGYEAKLFGPHNWHLGRCNSGMLSPTFKIDEDDIVITHFYNLPKSVKAKKIILALHEKNLFEVGKMEPFWDIVVFINENHRNYHSKYDGPYSIIPNLKENFEKKDKSHLDKIAGIIGSFDRNKQTHISIQRALIDGCDKVYLFGNISDQEYYNRTIKPLISDKVIEYGFVEDKQKMYDMIGRVYLSSKSEVASLVKDECESTDTQFFGGRATKHDNIDLPNEEIIKLWVKILEL